MTCVYLVVMGLASLAAALGLRSLPPAARPVARFGALTLALYAVGDLLWFVETWTGG